MRAIVLVIVVGALVGLSACASASAKAPPDRPTLEVPAPPTRVVEPSPPPEPVIEPVPNLPPATASNTRTAKPAAREPARTEPKPDAAVAETPPPPVTPVAPPPQLRTENTASDASEAARQVQAKIDQASKALDALNGRHFTGNKKAVYDNARGLLVQAEEALKKSDFENARKLAEKVELTAKELQGR